MKKRHFGEDDFIAYLLKQFPKEKDLVGIGDDCAVVSFNREEAWLVTTDALVEGVHFLKEQISPADLGYKSIAVNVSDVAAMGGRPKYVFFTIAIPKQVEEKWLIELAGGIKRACRKWNVLLLGGDTVGSKRDLFLSMTLIGSALSNQVKYRDSAKPGDVICVTGYLGDSGGGLKALQEKVSSPPKELIDAHFRPGPSPEEGEWLAAHKEVRAMMDISDGLNQDLSRLLTASHCGGVVELSKLPMSEALLKACKEQGWDPVDIALTGGEDYCLLFTVEKKSLKTLQEAFGQKFGKQLHPIGEVTDQRGTLSYKKMGKPIDLKLNNFTHF